MRGRVAPRAVRMAISERRATPRASCKIGDIGTDDEKNEQSRPHDEFVVKRCEIAVDVVEKRFDVDGPALIGGGIGFRKALGDQLHFRLRRVESDAVTQAAEDEERHGRCDWRVATALGAKGKKMSVRAGTAWCGAITPMIVYSC